MTDKWPSEEGFISEGEIVSLFKATAAVSQGTLVKLTGDLEVQPATANSDPVGVALKDGANGDIVPVCIHGVCKVKAGGAMADLETEHIVSQMTSDAGNSVAAGTSGTLAYSDVVNIVKECLIDGYTPDALAIHPSELADLLKDTAIQKAMEWGGEAIALSGQIARLLGMQVLVSTKVTTGTALVVDSKHAGVLFIRRDITAEDYEDPVKDLAGVAVTARWAYTTLRTDAIGKVTGC